MAPPCLAVPTREAGPNSGETGIAEGERLELVLQASRADGVGLSRGAPCPGGTR